jgi:hypothetical protein
MIISLLMIIIDCLDRFAEHKDAAYGAAKVNDVAMLDAPLIVV